MSSNNPNSELPATIPGAATITAIMHRAAESTDVGQVYCSIGMLSFLEEREALAQCTREDGSLNVDSYDKLLGLIEKRQRIRARGAEMLEKSKINQTTYVVPKQWEDAVQDHEDASQ